MQPARDPDAWMLRLVGVLAGGLAGFLVFGLAIGYVTIVWDALLSYRRQDERVERADARSSALLGGMLGLWLAWLVAGVLLVIGVIPGVVAPVLWFGAFLVLRRWGRWAVRHMRECSATIDEARRAEAERARPQVDGGSGASECAGRGRDALAEQEGVGLRLGNGVTLRVGDHVLAWKRRARIVALLRPGSAEARSNGCAEPGGLQLQHEDGTLEVWPADRGGLALIEVATGDA